MKALVLAVLFLCPLVACGGQKPFVPPPGPKTTPVETAATTTPVRPKATAKWNELTGPIKKITINAPKSLRPPIAADVSGLLDQPLARDYLRTKLVKAMKHSGVADVSAHGIQVDGGIELVIDVTMHPFVRKVSAFASGAPIPVTDGGGLNERLDPAHAQQAADNLRQNLIEKGYLNAEVTWRKVKSGDGVEVIFEATPGEASTIGSVGFAGNQAVKSDVLLKEIAQWLVPGQPVLDEQVERASMQISAYYWDHGHANVKVKSPVAVAGNNALVFTIEEGPIFKLGAIKITGDVPAIDHARYLKMFGVKQGDIFSRKLIADGRTRVSDAIVATGKKNANVLPLTKVDLVKKTIDITLEVEAK